MKTYRVVADARVQLDLNEAVYYLDSQQNELSYKFLNDYKKALEKLKINPLFQIRYKDIRCLPLDTFKYMIHFKVDTKNLIVTVFALISTHREPNKHWL